MNLSLARPLVATLALLLALLALPAGAASAGAVSAVSQKWWPETSKDLPVDMTTVTWRAAAGEANRLGVTVEPPRTVVLRDAVGPIAAGEGCVARPDGSAACPGLNADLDLWVDAGDGDDEVRATVEPVGVLYADGGQGEDLIAADGAFAVLDGGPGEDDLNGGDANDRLAGGDGADRLDGGAGRDILSGGLGDDRIDGGAGDRDRALYERRDDMHVDLRAGVGGHGAERDRIVAVERITSARGNDRILGSDRPETLSGGLRGRDLLDGRGGDDVLHGNGVTRTMRGGAGDDLLRNGARLIDAGPGDDRVDDPAGRVRCGPGHDRIVWLFHGRHAIVHGDCERIDSWNVGVSGLLRDGRALRLTVHGQLALSPDSCGVVVAARADGTRLADRRPLDGRPLSRRFVPLRASGRGSTATTVLRAATPLPSRLLLTLAYVRCNVDGRPLPPPTGRLTAMRVVPPPADTPAGRPTISEAAER